MDNSIQPWVPGTEGQYDRQSKTGRGADMRSPPTGERRRNTAIGHQALASEYDGDREYRARRYRARL